MPPIKEGSKLRSIEVSPHPAGGIEIREPVLGTRAHSLETNGERGKQNRVVQVVKPALVQEGVDGPGPDDAVIDHPAMPREAPTRGTGSLDDCGVLVMCLRQPGRDHAGAQEREELVAGHQSARKK